MASSEPMPTPGFLIWKLSTRWRAAVDRAVAPLGLTHAKYSLLASLFGMGRDGYRPSQRELADHTGLDPIYVSKLARSLEGDGLIERPADPKDTRAVRLGLTTKGKSVAEHAVGIVRTLQEELTAPLGGLNGAHLTSFVRDLEALLEATSSQPKGPLQ